MIHLLRKRKKKSTLLNNPTQGIADQGIGFIIIIRMFYFTPQKWLAFKLFSS